MNVDDSSVVDSKAQLTESLDECGLRFMLAQRHYIYLLNTLQYHERYRLQQRGLSPSYYVWAFHSDAQQACGISILKSQLAKIHLCYGHKQCENDAVDFTKKCIYFVLNIHHRHH